MKDSNYTSDLKRHLCGLWGAFAEEAKWPAPPNRAPSPSPTVLVFRPRRERALWTYASCGMSDPSLPNPLELHLFSKREDQSLIELLTIVADYHRTGSPLGLHHTVNFGRPWLEGSRCDYGLISLPYLDGPKLEEMRYLNYIVRCLWLIPITRAERDFKANNGVEALERLFDAPPFDYAEPSRPSVVARSDAN